MTDDGVDKKWAEQSMKIAKAAGAEASVKSTMASFLEWVLEHDGADGSSTASVLMALDVPVLGGTHALMQLVNDGVLTIDDNSVAFLTERGKTELERYQYGDRNALACLNCIEIVREKLGRQP